MLRPRGIVNPKHPTLIDIAHAEPPAHASFALLRPQSLFGRADITKSGVIAWTGAVTTAGAVTGLVNSLD